MWQHLMSVNRLHWRRIHLELSIHNCRYCTQLWILRLTINAAFAYCEIRRYTHWRPFHYQCAWTKAARIRIFKKKNHMNLNARVAILWRSTDGHDDAWRCESIALKTRVMLAGRHSCDDNKRWRAYWEVSQLQTKTTIGVCMCACCIRICLVFMFFVVDTLCMGTNLRELTTIGMHLSTTTCSSRLC